MPSIYPHSSIYAGLAICRDLVMAINGGKVGVRSTEGLTLLWGNSRSACDAKLVSTLGRECVHSSISALFALDIALIAGVGSTFWFSFVAGGNGDDRATTSGARDLAIDLPPEDKVASAIAFLRYGTVFVRACGW